MRSVVLGSLVPLVCLESAAAQPGGDIDLQTFRPAIDSRGYVTVDGGEVLGARQLSLGLVSTWARAPLALRGGGAEYRIDSLITPTLVTAIGLGWRLEVGASLPFGVIAGDRDPDQLGDPRSPNDDQRFAIASQGLGDLGLHAKWRAARVGGWSLAVAGSAFLPTAAERSWLGAGRTSWQVRGIAELRAGRVRVAGNAGVRARLGGTTTFRDMASGPATGGEVALGTAIPMGVAAAYALSPGKFEVLAEGFSLVPTAPAGYWPIEALAGIKVYLAEASHLSLGAGAGLGPEQGNPDLRAFLAIVFEPKSRVVVREVLEVAEAVPPPEPSDRDGDGFLDHLDACPDDPEDGDGFEDGDGCPEVDNDGDRILDLDDLCPDDPEDKDGIEDDDGCPERDADGDRFLDQDDPCPRPGDKPKSEADRRHLGCVKNRFIDPDSDVLEFSEIHFDYDSAVIQKRSYPLLAGIADGLNASPQLRLVEIGGHTDERGGDAYNLRLSRARAESVRTHLIGLGVAAPRLTAEGYGETQPSAKAAGLVGERAWRINRRVEFVIVRSE